MGDSFWKQRQARKISELILADKHALPLLEKSARMWLKSRSTKQLLPLKYGAEYHEYEQFTILSAMHDTYTTTNRHIISLKAPIKDMYDKDLTENKRRVAKREYKRFVRWENLKSEIKKLPDVCIGDYDDDEHSPPDYAHKTGDADVLSDLVLDDFLDALRKKLQNLENAEIKQQQQPKSGKPKTKWKQLEAPVRRYLDENTFPGIKPLSEHFNVDRKTMTKLFEKGHEDLKLKKAEYDRNKRTGKNYKSTDRSKSTTKDKSTYTIDDDRDGKGQIIGSGSSNTESPEAQVQKEEIVKKIRDILKQYSSSDDPKKKKTAEDFQKGIEESSTKDFEYWSFDSLETLLQALKDLDKPQQDNSPQKIHKKL